MPLFTNIMGGLSGLGALTSLSLFGSASSSLSTITMPASVIAGDVAVLLDFSSNSSASAPTNVVPSGWTQIGSGNDYFIDDAVGARVTMSYKILAGTEGGTSITGMAGTYPKKVMFVFRGNRAVAAVTAGSFTSTISLTNPSSITVGTTTASLCPLVVMGLGGCNNSTAAFTTESPAFDATVSPADADAIAGYKIYNSSPAMHTIDIADLGAINGLVGAYISCT